MIPVQEFLPRAVADMLRKAPLSAEKVAFAWRWAVGAGVHNATAIEWRSGVLHVRARDAAWRREIERSAAMIRARLDELLGSGVVRYINVTDGSAPGPSSGQSAGGSGSGRQAR
jgi:hypothetical protein